VYAGHFGAAMAMKARWPQVPGWVPFVGVLVLDFLFSLFGLLGLERVTPAHQVPGMTLDFIDWSHSLATSLVWGALFGLLVWLLTQKSRVAALVGAVAVVSHFALDFPMHPGDLTLWPYGPHVGLGLWVKWPVGWWFFELVFVLAGGGYYLARARKLGTFGGKAVLSVALMLVLHVGNSPWLLARGV
jgi:membrane-bound metal-dependent hydrolase YbcI (DUF457 family)